MKCYIVKDLLPRYIDGLTGEDVSIEIKDHLDDCEDCRRVYEQMSSTITEETGRRDRKIDFFKKLKRKIRKQYAVTALCVCLVFLVLIVFAQKYMISIPYEAEHMSVKIRHKIAIPNPPYTTIWEDMDLLDFETTKAVLAGEYEDCDTRDVVELRYNGYMNVSMNKYGRIIRRDGETVEVIYYCLSRKLFDLIIYGNGTEASRRGSLYTTGNLDEGLVYDADYKPRKTEIYYIPLKSLKGLKKLSDEDFDAQREKATLVWSGVI